MVIHDFSTTISCDTCSEEFTVNGNLSEKAMRTIARKDGWKVIKGKDVCPKCSKPKSRMEGDKTQ